MNIPTGPHKYIGLSDRGRFMIPPSNVDLISGFSIETPPKIGHNSIGLCMQSTSSYSPLSLKAKDHGCLKNKSPFGYHFWQTRVSKIEATQIYSTKLFAICRPSWLLVQCIARGAQGLRRSDSLPRYFNLLFATLAAISELELATMASLSVLL